MNVQAINILDELKNNGEAKITEDLSSFSCKINPAIENFIKNRAIDFARRKLSITYIVIDSDDGQIIGYFALTHKAVLISNSKLSNTSRKKLERFARLDRATGDYMASAFLIAQFGKNYAVDDGIFEWGTLDKGTYSILVKAFPYRDWEGTVNAT